MLQSALNKEKIESIEDEIREKQEEIKEAKERIKFIGYAILKKEETYDNVLIMNFNDKSSAKKQLIENYKMEIERKKIDLEKNKETIENHKKELNKATTFLNEKKAFLAYICNTSASLELHDKLTKKFKKIYQNHEAI